MRTTMTTKNEILDLVAKYIKEKHANEAWKEGDWISYSGPQYDEKEYVAAVDTLLDEWLIFGPKAREFEKIFPAFLGKRLGTLVNSGSSANLLMLVAAKSKSLNLLQEGDKILTPVVCFPTTLNPIIQNGFIPVFVDVDLPSLNLNLDQTEELLKKDPSIKAFMFAHVLGNPPNMKRVMELVNKYNLLFFEDSCDALGGTYDGRLLGSFGIMSTCSLFPAHHCSGGEGGFVATDDINIQKVVTSLRDWGRGCFCNTKTPGNVTSGAACKNRHRNWLPGFPELTYDHRYVFEEIGYNLKPIEVQGALLLEQIKKLPLLDQARRDNHKSLYNIFSKYQDYFMLPVAEPNSDPCWFAFLLTVKDNKLFTKEEFVQFLESKKIQTRSYFSGNILAHPGYNHLYEGNDLKGEFPNAYKATKDSFFLGTFAGINEEKLKYISKCVNEFFFEKEYTI